MIRRLLWPISIFVAALVIIVVGALLTISVVFSLLGVPLIILGVVLAISSVILFVKIFFHGIFSGLLHIIAFLLPKKPGVAHKKLVKRPMSAGKVVEVEEEGGVYQQK
jgi:hypothetical protein